METVLLLIVIAVVVAVFVWLGRVLRDEWPPRPVADPLPQGEGVSGPLLESDRAVPLPGRSSALPIAPLPEREFALSATVGSARGDGAGGPRPNPLPQGKVATPLPPRSPALPQGAELRRVAWALVGGGGLLLALSQWVGRLSPDGSRLPTFALSLISGLALLLGVQTFMRGGLAGWFGRALVRLAAGLRVTPVQMVWLLLALPYAWLTRQAAGNGLLAHSATVAIIAWLVAIGLAVAGSVDRTRQEGATQAAGDESTGRWHLDRWDVAISLIIFALALGLRAWQMSQFPSTYSGDEGSSGLFAVELLDGKANNLFSLGWFSFPALYFTVQSAAITLVGQTVEAVRLTSAVAGALTVVAIYWLGRAMFDRTTAVLAALYLAASHYHIHMSRIALNNVWDGLFGTLAILGLWYGWKTGRRAGFILCGLALGLGQYFYVSIRPLPILFLLWAAAALVAQRAQFRERFHGLVLRPGSGRTPPERARRPARRSRYPGWPAPRPAGPAARTRAAAAAPVASVGRRYRRPR